MNRFIRRIVGRKINGRGLCEDLILHDLSDVKIADIVTTYTDIWVEYIENEETVYHCNIMPLIDALSSHTRLFIEWIFFLEVESIVLGPIEILDLSVEYRDAHVANIDVRLTKMGSHPDNKWSRKEQRDLLITKDGVDNEHLFDNVLVSVNDHILRTSLSIHGVYVVDGAYGLHTSNNANIGVISFEELGGVKSVDIKSENILPVDGVNPRHKVYLSVDDDFTDKTVGLVLAGRLYILDGICEVTSERTVRIDMGRIPHIHNYFESKGAIDFGDYQFTMYPYDYNRRKVNEIMNNDDWVRHLLNLPTSFLVVINNPNVTRVDVRLENAKLSSTLYAHKEPKGILIGRRNLPINYTTYDDDGVWVVKCSDDRLPNYAFETIDWENRDSVSDTKLTMKPYREASISLMRLFSNKVI